MPGGYKTVSYKTTSYMVVKVVLRLLLCTMKSKFNDAEFSESSEVGICFQTVHGLLEGFVDEFILSLQIKTSHNDMIYTW